MPGSPPTKGRRGVRLLACVLWVLVCSCLAYHFGPRPQLSWGDVYTILPGPVGAFHHQEIFEHLTEPRRTVFNGQESLHWVGKANLPIPELFQFIQQNKTSYTASLSEEMGIMATFVPSQKVQDRISPVYPRFALSPLLLSEPVGEYGNVTIFIANRASESEETTCIVLQPQAAFDYSMLCPINEGIDSPGNDPDVIPRPLNSNRVFSFEQELAGTRSLHCLYLSNAQPIDLLDFYKDFFVQSEGYQFENTSGGDSPSIGFIANSPQTSVWSSLREASDIDRRKTWITIAVRTTVKGRSL